MGNSKCPAQGAPACRPTLLRRTCWDLPAIEGGRQAEECAGPTDMSSELSTVTTAARARPHLDLTMSILPGGQKRVRAASPQSLAHRALHPESWERACLTVEEGRPWFVQRNVDPSQSRGTVSLETFPGRDFL